MEVGSCKEIDKFYFTKCENVFYNHDHGTNNGKNGNTHGSLHYCNFKTSKHP